MSRISLAHGELDAKLVGKRGQVPYYRIRAVAGGLPAECVGEVIAVSAIGREPHPTRIARSAVSVRVESIGISVFIIEERSETAGD